MRAHPCRSLSEGFQGEAKLFTDKEIREQNFRFAWRGGGRPDATLSSPEHRPIPLDRAPTHLVLHRTSISLQVSPRWKSKILSCLTHRPGKEEPQELEVQACLGEDLTTWGPLVAKAKHSLMARQEGEVVGLLSAWQVDTLKEEREEPAKKHANALQDLKGVKTITRLWGCRDSLAWLLQPTLLLEVRHWMSYF